jgi:hypothetical protein
MSTPAICRAERASVEKAKGCREVQTDLSRPLLSQGLRTSSHKVAIAPAAVRRVGEQADDLSSLFRSRSIKWWAYRDGVCDSTQAGRRGA